MPGPDLIRVVGVARSLEPMLQYSEVGSKQVTQLSDTGLAVSDLGESVKQSNMTSAPIITREIGELGNDLRTLATELNEFFQVINGDVDDILNTMEWAHGELTRATTEKPTKISSAVDRLSNLAVTTSRGKIPHFSPQIHRLFGMQNSHQTNRIALSRSFYELLGSLEENVTKELKQALKLEGMFTNVDGQFGNIQRTIIREIATQENLVDGELATLWARVFGISSGKQYRIDKYERNRRLLTSLRDHTGSNRKTLAEHKLRLIALKTNIDELRKRIVSPLMRSENNTTAGLREQLEGLERTWHYLNGVRGAQKGRIAQGWYASDNDGGKWPAIGGRNQ